MNTEALITAIEALETRLSDSIHLQQSCIAVLDVTRCHLMSELAKHSPTALLDFIMADSPDEVYNYLP